MRRLFLVACLYLLTATAQAAAAEIAEDLEAGRVLAVRICAECHDVEARNAAAFSPSAAPTFYQIANAKTSTALGLSVFLQTPHQNMPNIILSDDERRALVAYILQFREGR